MSITIWAIFCLTQAEIGERIGWSREQVKDYITTLNKIGAQTLNLAKQHQIGRAPTIGAFAPFNFTEGWFRGSGTFKKREGRLPAKASGQ